MARKRYITSAMSVDRKLSLLAEENPTAALMWPWFITAFDDWGRMSADPVEVKLTVFPAFPFTSSEIGEAIKLYDKYGLAHYYLVDNKPYLAVNPSTWWKYQNYIKFERKKGSSRYPPPPNPPWNEQLSAMFAENPRISAKNLPSPSPSPSPTCINISSPEGEGELQDGQGSESYEQREGVKTAPDVMPHDGSSGEKAMGETPQEEASAPTVGKAAVEYDPDFETFWNFYPRHVEKKRAYRVWRTRLREGVSPGDMINAARKYREICLKTGTNERFIKHPATFIGPDKPYEDFLPKKEMGEIGECRGHPEEDSGKTIDFDQFLWKGGGN